MTCQYGSIWVSKEKLGPQGQQINCLKEVSSYLYPKAPKKTIGTILKLVFGLMTHPSAQPSGKKTEPEIKQYCATGVITRLGGSPYS